MHSLDLLHLKRTREVKIDNFIRLFISTSLIYDRIGQISLTKE